MNGDWLRLPSRWFWTYVHMMDRLRAEESLELVSIMLATGGRHLADGDHRDYLNELRQTANGGEMPRPVKGTWEMLGQSGIGVTREPGVHPGWDALEQSEEVRLAHGQL